jgi:hypothetical protein
MTASPLTTFIIEMLKADRSALANADPAKLASKYGINPDHARGYLALQTGAPTHAAHLRLHAKGGTR